jgi:pyruvate,water dikinase
VLALSKKIAGAAIFSWWKRKREIRTEPPVAAEERIRSKYHSFRELLSFNNECLELMAGLQEDLQYIPPRRDVIGDRITAIFEKAEAIVAALERLSGLHYASLIQSVHEQRNEVERHVAALQELTTPRLSAWLSEVNADHVSEVGGKAAALGEIKNKLDVPVPNGYVLTTEAYHQFCGIPLWKSIRDAVRAADLNDLDALRSISSKLAGMVIEQPVPRAVEVAISERALTLETSGLGLAVRSSAVGEGGEKTFAGQFLSLLNVSKEQVVDAYRTVIAGRFGESALSYRLSTGLSDVESPMAVLFLPIIRARASGIMYTRDPGNPKSTELWITATRGLALDIASGRMAADLFIMSRKRPRNLLESHIVHKDEEIVAEEGGGLTRRPLPPGHADQSSLRPEDLNTLAEWGVRIEDHFKTAQDVEWALDHEGKIWILQARSLALAEPAAGRAKARPRGEPLVSGGRTIYPGRVSGAACLIEDLNTLGKTPNGAILILRKASPEIVGVLPRIGGLVAEWGNVAGHAAALLREFKVPSVFLMKGCFEHIHAGDLVSLDAVQEKIYAGTLWEPRKADVTPSDRFRERSNDPISRRVLNLNLLDPAAFNFRPAGCKSTHDVLRFCHEKAVEAMFDVNDIELESGQHRSKKLKTAIPLNVYVMDIGHGLTLEDPESVRVTPQEIVSRPFQSFWKGLTHPAVTWTREMPASLSDLASVMAGSFSPQGNVMRALGDKSYLLVADEYMNLNSRLAYHFSLVDACLSEIPGNNYISFRFAGGGATRQRRNLRACFIEACLSHYGFLVDRRGDLVNAWYKKGPATETSAKLDILGRLMGCSGQLDMYMSSHEAMKWYVGQFIEGNYAFRPREEDTIAR